VVTLAGGFARPGKAGPNRLRFRGRLRGHKLRRGRYTLVARPTANGRTGRSVGAGFRIVK
jgi:hypothetical protein